MKRYNLASGNRYLDGWVNIDITQNLRVDIVMNLGIMPWDIEDGSAHEILASHILEHFYKERAWEFLTECYRILEPGGELHVAVPDMDKFIECNLAGDWSALKGYKWRDLNHLLGGDEREHNEYLKHKYMYNFETLAYMLESVGFIAKKRVMPLYYDSPEYQHFSLYVDAVK